MGIGKREWPDEVPVLSGSDFICGSYKDDKERCLLGWARGVFAGRRYDSDDGDVIYDYDTGATSGPFKTVVAALVDAVKGKDAADVASFNDSATGQACARVWNKTMAKLGYTEQA